MSRRWSCPAVILKAGSFRVEIRAAELQAPVQRLDSWYPDQEQVVIYPVECDPRLAGPNDPIGRAGHSCRWGFYPTDSWMCLSDFSLSAAQRRSHAINGLSDGATVRRFARNDGRKNSIQADHLGGNSGNKTRKSREKPFEQFHGTATSFIGENYELGFAFWIRDQALLMETVHCVPIVAFQARVTANLPRPWVKLVRRGSASTASSILSGSGFMIRVNHSWT